MSLLTVPASARGRVFPFEIEDPASFRLYSKWVRRDMARILGMLANPCTGKRLRDDPSARPTLLTWADFCKINLSDDVRLIYQWAESESLVILHLIGRHTGMPDSDVYALLEGAFDLEPSHEHRRGPVYDCCHGAYRAGRTLLRADAEAHLRRAASRGS